MLSNDKSAFTALFSMLQAEIQGDIDLESRAYGFYRSLLPDVETEVFREELIPITVETFLVTLGTNENYADYKARLISTIRRRTRSHLLQSNYLLIRALDKIEKTYLRGLNRYRHLPVITYKALTLPAVRNRRLELMGSFGGIDRLDESSVIDAPNWRDNVENYLEALNGAKELTITMSKDIVDWDKYIGDIWRLNTAVISLALGIISLFGFKLFDYFRPSHQMSIAGTCTQTHKPDEMKCTFVSK